MSEDYEEVYDDETLHWISENFPQLSGGVAYLDHAGSTLYSAHQLTSLHAHLTTKILRNPHTGGGQRLEEVRELVLQMLNTNCQEYAVVFNSGVTSGLKCVGEAFPWTPHSAFFIHVESHTSAVGIREYAKKAGATIFPWSDDDIHKLLCWESSGGKNLVCLPAMSNFHGYKWDLELVTRLQTNQNNLVLLDAACLLSTSPLDLSAVRPDFVVFSFYKMFGYPTGLGALLIRRCTAGPWLTRSYFGGGTVDMHLVQRPEHQSRKRLEERLEDGTHHFLGIEAVPLGLLARANIRGGVERISEHVFRLARYTYQQLSALEHLNGKPVVKIYAKTKYESARDQGGIVNFNLMDSRGEYVGYAAFNRIADNENIILRTGCFCNTGSCQLFLPLSDEDIEANYTSGHVCGDDLDLVDGRPTGSIRVSFGYMSTRQEADRLIRLIRDYFVESAAAAPQPQDASEQDRGPLKIVALYIYPVKSCRGIKVDSWPVTSSGLAYDRQWAIMQGERVLTQKTEPLLAQIGVRIDLPNQLLVLSFPGMAELQVSLAYKTDDHVETASICTGKICGQGMQGVSCGSAASEWLEEALARPGLRLVRGAKTTVEKNNNRNSTNTYNSSSTNSYNNNSSSLSNESHILTLNMASIRRLRWEIWQRGEMSQEELESTFSIQNLTIRFRGNLVVEGVPAFQEEACHQLMAAQTLLHITSPCKRCTVIGVDQESGEISREPLRSLAAMKDRKSNFGVHTKVVDIGSGVLEVGTLIEHLPSHST